MDKAICALEMAGVLRRDDDGRPLWCGGNTIAVQLGDVLDRGDTEIGTFLLLKKWECHVCLLDVEPTTYVTLAV